MAQYDLNLRDYQRILRRRWKVVVFATVLVTGLSYYFGTSRQPLYQTFSSVKIDETGTMAGLLMQRLTYSRWDNIATAQELIKSFPIVEEVARRMGIVPDSISSEELLKDPKLSARINELINMITTERNGNTNIIDIKVVSPDPYEARDVAQNLAVVFTEEHQNQRSKQDRETREFIEKQLRQAKVLLENAEDSLKAFRQANPGPVLDDEIRLRVEENVELRREMRQVEKELQELEIQYNEIGNRIKEGEEQAGDSRGQTEADSSSIALVSPGIDWISSSQGSGPLGLLNRKILELELEKRDLLERYNADYPGVREVQAKIDDLLLELQHEVEGNLQSLYAQRDSLAAYIERNEAALEGVPGKQRRYAEILREVSLREDQYSLLSEKYQEALIREADKADEVTVVRPAILNEKPININIARTVSVGLVIGLMLGLILALLFETFDTSIGTIEDVEEYLQVPVLGVIPHINIDDVVAKLLKKDPSLENNPNLESVARLVTHFAPKDPVAEAFRTLRTTIQFRSITHPVKSIVATSAALQEGKSTTLVNLAITLAQDGSRVLLVGCNLRRPTLYKVFGLEQEEGVIDIIVGRTPWRDTVKGVTDFIIGGMGMESILMTPGLENLNIITSGGVPPNPAEMLGSEKMKQFMNEAKKEYDMVLFDAPPVLPVTDAAILANRTDAALLIYRSGMVPRAALRRAKTQIETVGGNVLGVVLNDLKAEIAGTAGSHYYYGKYYGDRERKSEDVIGGEKVPQSRLARKIRGLQSGKSKQRESS